MPEPAQTRGKTRDRQAGVSTLEFSYIGEGGGSSFFFLSRNEDCHRKYTLIVIIPMVMTNGLISPKNDSPCSGPYSYSPRTV